jgi:hypothetical protein
MSSLLFRLILDLRPGRLRSNDITTRDGHPKPDPKLRDYENTPFLFLRIQTL